MRRLSEIASTARFAILDGRTMRENHEWHLARRAAGTNIGGPNYRPPPPLPAVEPPGDPGGELELLRLHLARAGVPERAAQVLEAPRDTSAMVAVRAWASLPASFMLLHGDSGAGKTIAACGAFLSVKRTIRWTGGQRTEWHSEACAFQPAAEVAQLGYYSDDAHELLDYLGRVRWLVLDDLGTELKSESWRAELDALVAERHGRLGCKTILTTNLSCKPPAVGKPSPFEERYGARIARRIRESGNVVAVTNQTQEAT